MCILYVYYTRHAVGDVTNIALMHDDDVIIQCFMPLDLYEYNTQLILNSEALNSSYPSSGVLKIYSSNQSGAAFWGWSNVYMYMRY
jgi:hypothetical protein